MIKDLKFNGAQLGEYSFPYGEFAVYQYVNFLSRAELTGNHVAMSIIASYHIAKISNDESIVMIPCTSNYEFQMEEELTEQDLMPLWKRSVKHLKDECNKLTQYPELKKIAYPSNDFCKESIRIFLDAGGKIFTRKASQDDNAEK